jgi:hypothetical protein
MAGHEMNLLVQSIDGGESWVPVTTEPGMTQKGGTASINFIDTSDKSTTRTTWLWLAQLTGGTIGTWRTPDGGVHWAHEGSSHLETIVFGTPKVVGARPGRRDERRAPSRHRDRQLELRPVAIRRTLSRGRPRQSLASSPHTLASRS